MVKPRPLTLPCTRYDIHYLKDKTPEDWRDVAEFIVEKQRNGPAQETAYVRWVKECASFENVPGLGKRLRESAT